MQTGQRHDASHSYGSTWQNARYALNYFLANLPPASATAEDGGDDTFHLRPHNSRGLQPVCTVALSNDHMAIILKLGDGNTWRAAATPDAPWQSDQTSQWQTPSEMARTVSIYLSQPVVVQ